LSIVQNIVSRYGGSVTLESQVGVGTRACVVLPACSDAVSKSSAEHSQARPARRALKLACIDDEPLVLSWLVRALERAGHEVVAFSDPLEARRYLLGGQAAVDCVICDENMPFLTGTALAAQLAERSGAPPVVLISGYAAVGLDATTPNVRARLSKPLAAEALLEALERVVS
jgi:DNA-binding NtrC family response regulator